MNLFRPILGLGFLAGAAIAAVKLVHLYDRVQDGEWTAVMGEVPEEEAGPEPWEDPSPCREERLVLSAALQSLSEEERQIVTLHAVSGFRFREVASFLELPLNTVLSKYHRAMKRLRRQLSEEEGV